MNPMEPGAPKPRRDIKTGPPGPDTQGARARPLESQAQPAGLQEREPEREGGASGGSILRNALWLWEREPLALPSTPRVITPAQHTHPPPFVGWGPRSAGLSQGPGQVWLS